MQIRERKETFTYTQKPEKKTIRRIRTNTQTIIVIKDARGKKNRVYKYNNRK